MLTETDKILSATSVYEKERVVSFLSALMTRALTCQLSTLMIKYSHQSKQEYFMIDAIKNFFKGYVDFSGRSTRPDYWWIGLVNIILAIPFYIVYGSAIDI